MKFLQANLNRCKAAQELLHQTVREKEIDVLIVTEPNKKIVSNWHVDQKTNAVTRICNNKIRTGNTGK